MDVQCSTQRAPAVTDVAGCRLPEFQRSLSGSSISRVARNKGSSNGDGWVFCQVLRIMMRNGTHRGRMFHVAQSSRSLESAAYADLATSRASVDVAGSPQLFRAEHHREDDRGEVRGLGPACRIWTGRKAWERTWGRKFTVVRRSCTKAEAPASLGACPGPLGRVEG